MRATYEVWSADYDDHDRVTRAAGAGVTVHDVDGQAMTFTVPTPRIAQLTSDLLNEYMSSEPNTPHQLHHLAQHLGTVAFYFGLEWTVGVALSHADDDVSKLISDECLNCDHDAELHDPDTGACTECNCPCYEMETE